MKKIKIYSSISLILGLLLALVSVLVPIIKINEFTAQNGSVGIIGGADGPTAIYLTSHLLDGNLLFTFILGLTLFLCGGFCLIFGKYSLQGTTQGNGLTGGLPPVRFSM